MRLTPEQLREQIENALWDNAHGKDYYKAPMSVRREILDIVMPLVTEFTAAEQDAARGEALREAAKKLQKQAEEYGCEHGQVDPTTGAWEATELEMQYCETLDQAAEDILALDPSAVKAAEEQR